MSTPAPEPEGAPTRARSAPRPDRLVAACVLALLAFPLACVLVAAREPVQPQPWAPSLPSDRSGPAGRLLDLPTLAARGGAGRRAPRRWIPRQSELRSPTQPNGS